MWYYSYVLEHPPTVTLGALEMVRLEKKLTS